VRGIDIIYVDTPSVEAVKKSSSYNLSIFSFGGNLEGAEVIAPMKIVAQASGSYGPA
jgi:hypothetical protein